MLSNHQLMVRHRPSHQLHVLSGFMYGTILLEHHLSKFNNQPIINHLLLSLLHKTILYH
jgi:hypothetical protein